MRRTIPLLLALAGVLTATATAHAAAWLPPVALPGDSLYGGSVAMDGAGNVYIAEDRAYDDPARTDEGVYVVARPAGGGPFTDLVKLGDASDEGTTAVVANARGDVAAISTATPIGDCPYALSVRIKPAGQPFGGAKALEDGCNGQVGIDDAGNVTVAYLRVDAGVKRVRETTIPFGGEPSSPVYLSVANKDVTVGSLRMQVNGAGDAVIAWSRTTTAPHQLAAVSVRPRGATFGAGTAITTDDGYDAPFGFGSSDLSLAPDGTIGVLTFESDSGHHLVKEFTHVGSASGGVPMGVAFSGFHVSPVVSALSATVARAGGVTMFGIDGSQAYSGPATAAGLGATAPYLAANDIPLFGTPTLAGGYVQSFVTSSGPTNIGLVYEPPSGAAVIARPAKPSGQLFAETAYRPAVSAAGDAAAILVSETEAGRLLVLDATPPAFTAQSIPKLATTGQAVSFSAAASDATSGVSYHWDFGDGSGADGPAVTHAFGASGPRNVTVAATDEGGNVATAGGPITVSDPAPPVVPVIRPPVVAPTVRCHVPTLTGHTEAYARKALAKGHCKLGTVRRPARKSQRHSSRLRVRSQTVKHGTYRTKDTKVGITLAIPAPRKSKKRA